MTLDGIAKSIEKISTASGDDIRAMEYAMVDVKKDAISEGRIVRCSLRISLSIKGANHFHARYTTEVNAEFAKI